MKLLRFFKGHALAVAICALLLVVQANLELSLPNYMSNIVDVGLQQGGIDSPVPETIRESELANLQMFMTEADANTVQEAYGQEKDGVLTYEGTAEEGQASGRIGEIMTLPECVVLSLEEGISPNQLAHTDLSTALSEDDLAKLAATPDGATAAAQLQQALAAHDGKLTLEAVRILYDNGLVTRDQLISAANAMNDALGEVGGQMLAQRAISFVQREYEAQGISLTDVQNQYLGHMALIMFGLCLGTLVTTVAVGFVASRTAACIARDTRKTLFSRVMNFSPTEVGRFSQASLITRSTNDVQQIQMVCVMLLRMIMLAPIMGIVAFIQVTATHSGMEWIIGVALLAIFAVLGILLGTTMPKFKRMQSLVDRLNLVSRDMLDGLMPIRAFGREPFELNRFDAASTNLMKTQLFVNRAMAFMMPVIMLVMNLVTLLIVWVGAQGVDVGTLQVGTMMAFITYTMQIVMSFMVLGMVAVMLPRAQVAAERVAEVIDCPLSIESPAAPEAPAAGSPKGVVEFRDVTFRYPDAERPVVRNVSFRTEAGKTLGIIGSTGSGKSTLVKLIPRLYDATEGNVLIDGTDVRAMELADVRRRIGYVPQQGFLFSGTIESNIKFANEAMDDGQMRHAAEVAQAMEFIEKEPEGFETPIAQKGANVSGGQRQRLSIARALAAQPEILVFDDSFSALDYATDARLREALREGAGNAAVVIVAQRVATIMQADEILVLEAGDVVGRGTHRQLLDSCETYREIALSQLSAAELGLPEEAAAEAVQAEAAEADAIPADGKANVAVPAAAQEGGDAR
ncbi:ABC transporter ATP-binding protein [Parvibacter caecicola]|uniref:ABC transporter ATP-binding protein n=1 Tax=Parvibacter caecicola TaxID=747645 RepID=UPI0023F0CDAC|nr:ABC transporter ATP-binding protein [Parvibacter caecicola]